MEWLKSLVSHTTLVQWLILAALVSLGAVLRELTAAVKALIDLLDKRLGPIDRHYARIEQAEGDYQHAVEDEKHSRELFRRSSGKPKSS
jgi:hypothetical protein